MKNPVSENTIKRGTRPIPGYLRMLKGGTHQEAPSWIRVGDEPMPEYDSKYSSHQRIGLRVVRNKQ